MKMFAVSVMALVAGSASAATVSQWDLTGAPGTQAFTTGTAITNVTALDLARGAGLSGNAGANSINAAGWNNQATDYFSFGFSVAAGYAVDMGSLFIGSRSSATGPGTLGLYYSGDGFTTSLYTFNQAPGGNNVNQVVDLSGLGNLTGNVEFRVMQIGSTSANGGTTGASGTFRLTAYFVNGNFDRNLQITGDVVAVPAPGALALVGLGGLAMARRRR